MLKKIKMKVLFTLMIMMTSTFFLGCSLFNKPGDRLKEVKPMTVSVEGVEFKVGESKLGDILDGGLLISADTNFKEKIDGLQLEKMKYYFAYVNKDDYNLGEVNFVNNTKKSMDYRDCTISEYKMKFAKTMEAGSKQYKYDNILIDGINFNGMTIDDVKKVMSEKTEDVSAINQPDGSIAILNYTVNNIYFSISFDYRTKIVNEVDVQVFNTFFE